MSRVIDTVLSWLKWPVAAWLLLSVPQLLGADLALLAASITERTAPFWLGLLAYIALWWLLLRRRVWGSFLPTLSHELTHGLFAILTFHRILSLKATWRDGGEIQYTGPGNWLITIAPYFFPLTLTLAIPLLALLSVAAPVRLALLGGIAGFEVIAMGRQLHRGQPDIGKVGLLFTAAFLPGALLWTFGAVLTLALHDESAMLRFLTGQWRDHWQMLAEMGRQVSARLN